MRRARPALRRRGYAERRPRGYRRTCWAGRSRAAVTVTFGRRKYGHLLLPGRARAGEVVVADIGIPEAEIDELKLRVHENGPALWQGLLPGPDAADHKYSRGHALVVGGDGTHSGAARLAARAALRIGAGLVTVHAPEAALPVYAVSTDRRHGRVPGRAGDGACRRAPQRAADRPRLRCESRRPAQGRSRRSARESAACWTPTRSPRFRTSRLRSSRRSDPMRC